MSPLPMAFALPATDRLVIVYLSESWLLNTALPEVMITFWVDIRECMLTCVKGQHLSCCIGYRHSHARHIVSAMS